MVQWDPELEQVLCAVERKGVQELTPSAVQALKELLTQVPSTYTHKLTQSLSHTHAHIHADIHTQTHTNVCSSH